MKGTLVAIIIVLLLVIGGMATGYIQFGVPETEEPQEEIKMPDETFLEEAEETEVTEEDDGGIAIRTPSKDFGGRDVTLSVDDDDNWSLDIYDFMDEVDLSGFTADPEESCEDECDDYCSEDADACVAICENVNIAACGNAAVQLTVCETACAAAPPPFNVLCSDGCDAAFEAACSEEAFEQCKDDCQDIHYGLCLGECYDTC